MSVCLVTVVSGEPYARYADQLGESADEFFHPHPKTGFLILEGREGWPDATLYRYHVLLENQLYLRRFDHVFLCDADMRFEAVVGEEIIGDVVATEHPGYVGRPRHDLPYERRTWHSACLPPGVGERYYAGGFVGGKAEAFLSLATRIVRDVDRHDYGDFLRDDVAVWHDESHLNRLLATDPPTVVLSPSYCYPDDDSGYDLSRYERKLVALDKTPAERRGR